MDARWIVQKLNGMRTRTINWLYPRAANCLICGDPRNASLKDCLCDRCREKGQGA